MKEAVRAMTVGLWVALPFAVAAILFGNARAAGPAPSFRGFALVELFTSEGCSSCPPADAVASRIARDAAESGEPVFVLVFHVDYWDRLGWPDRFASAAFTERQRAYASAWKARQVYTPQMVVNGEAEFVGSDSARAEKEIESALERPATVPVEIEEARAVGDGVLSVRARVVGAPDRGVVWVAVTEDGLSSEVKRGENAGRRLAHAAVVRGLVSALPGSEGRVESRVSVPADLNLERARVVVFVQDGESLRVLAAAGRGVAE